MQLLESFSETSLMIWVIESNYGYPIVLSLHAVGMALVIGIMLMFNLRVLGLVPSIPLSSVTRFFKVAWIGLAINLISGTLLFCGNYSAFLHNTAFLSKLSLLIAGSIGTWFLAKEVRNSTVIIQPSPNELASKKAKIIAAALILIWLSAITAGRIVGYTSIPE
ncbi:hypothetical protein NBRC116493_32380 [Aurantivibrio infirmus]